KTRRRQGAAKQTLRRPLFLFEARIDERRWQSPVTILAPRRLRVPSRLRVFALHPFPFVPRTGAPFARPSRLRVFAIQPSRSMPDDAGTHPLTPPQLHAVRYVVARVRSEVAAELVQASLFGSRARGDARPDSDVDILLVFRSLPPDREPSASDAESIAEQEARRLHVPVTVWSVSLEDLAVGQRTPMLVDALADSIPLWCREAPLPAVPFTPVDAIHCVETLLRRID